MSTDDRKILLHQCEELRQMGCIVNINEKMTVEEIKEEIKRAVDKHMAALFEKATLDEY